MTQDWSPGEVLVQVKVRDANGRVTEAIVPRLTKSWARKFLELVAKAAASRITASETATEPEPVE